MRLTNLDLDALRSFVTGLDAGSYARAADRLGRSTSAVSAQLKKLEEQVGAPLLQRAGRGLGLTGAGEALLPYARRLLGLNDEAIAALRREPLQGWVRLGIQEDFGQSVLPQVLGQFAQAHPQVRIEGRIARNAELLDKVAGGQLDLALTWDEGNAAAARIAVVPLCWLGAADGGPQWHRNSGEPLPLIALEAPCLMRTLACEALDRHGIPWRLAFVSPSLGGLWAATAAGLGFALRTPIGLPATLRALSPGTHGLPPLPSLGLALHRAPQHNSAPAMHLAGIIEQALQAALPGGWLVPGALPLRGV